MSSSQFFVAIGLVVGALLELAFRSFSAKILGVEGFGQLVFINSMLLVLGSVATLGSGNIIPRYIAIFSVKNKDRISTFIAVFTRLVTFVSIVISSLIYSFDLMFGFEKEGVLFLIALIPLFVLSEVVYAVNRGFLNTRKAIFQREIIRRGVPLVLLLIIFTMNIKVSVETLLIFIGIGLITSIIYSGRRILISRVDRNIVLPIKEIKSFALPLIVSSVLMQINARMDVFYAGLNLSNTELGIYSASIVLPQLLSMLPGVFAFSLLPYLSRLYEDQKINDMRKLFFKTSKQLLFLGLCISGSFWIGSTWWVDVIFGKSFSQGALLFDIIILSNFLMSCIGAFGVTMIAAGQTKQYLKSDLAALIFGGALQWFLSIGYGLDGLALGVLATTLFLVVIRGGYVLRLLNININIKYVNLFYIFFVLVLFVAILLFRVFVVEFSVVFSLLVWVALCFCILLLKSKSIGFNY